VVVPTIAPVQLIVASIDSASGLASLVTEVGLLMRPGHRSFRSGRSSAVSNSLIEDSWPSDLRPRPF
jgi:hypothetical protein